MKMRQLTQLSQLCSKKIAIVILLALACAAVLVYTQRDSEDEYIRFLEVRKPPLRKLSDAAAQVEYRNPYGPYKGDFIPFTDVSESRNLLKRQFWDALQPGYKCPDGLLARVGGSGWILKRDGWKFMCGLETLGDRSLQEGINCTLYSFGVSGDSSFEAVVLKKTRCSLHAYDHTVSKIGSPLTMSNPRVHFQKLGISGDDSSGNMRTLKTLMDANGHKFIDILKVDVEGAEFGGLEAMLQDFHQLPFGQLLVEFHCGKRADLRERFYRLIRNLERRGARLFYMAKNDYNPDCCAELSLINLNYLPLFIPDAQVP